MNGFKLFYLLISFDYEQELFNRGLPGWILSILGFNSTSSSPLFEALEVVNRPLPAV